MQKTKISKRKTPIKKEHWSSSLRGNKRKSLNPRDTSEVMKDREAQREQKAKERSSAPSYLDTIRQFKQLENVLDGLCTLHNEGISEVLTKMKKIETMVKVLRKHISETKDGDGQLHKG